MGIATVPDDVVLNKIETIERCLARIQEELRGDLSRLSDQTAQDAIVLNLLRACEASIDLAMHVVAREHLGVPQESRQAFALLEQAGAIDTELSVRLQGMVGFRNVAVHDYRRIELAILAGILSERLGDFEALSRALFAWRKP